MNNFHHFNERLNEVFVLDDSDKSFEKNNNSISSNSNIKSKDNILNNIKHQKFDVMISKMFPKLSLNSFHFTKIGNSNAHEDLTEVTATDIITEPSDLHKSNELMNEILQVFPQSLGLSSKNHLINHKNFIMLNTEEPLSNFDVFPRRNSIPDQYYTNPIKFPLLQVEKLNVDFQINKQPINFHRISPPINAIKIKNNFSHFDFFVPPEKIIKTKWENISFTRNDKQSKVENNPKFPIITNDMVLNLENPDANTLMDLNEKKIFCSENINGNINAEDSTLNILSNSDIALYNGYAKTADSAEYLHRNVTGGRFPQTLDKTPSYKADISKNSEKHIAKEKQINIADNDNIYNGNNTVINQAGKEHDWKYQKPTADLHIMPILPPDLLGQVHFQTGNNAKHFLAIKSIDENGWDELLDINMSDKNDAYSSEHINNYHYEESLLNRNKTSSFHKNLNETFCNIDKKITEIHRNSFDINEDFPINPTVLLNSNKKNHYLEYNSHKSINDRFEKSLAPAVEYEETGSSKSDVLLVTDPSISLSDTEVLNTSSRSLSKVKFMPKFNFHDIGADKTENTEYSIHNEKSLDKISVKPRSLINKTRFRNHMEKSNYFRRKYNGKQLALQVLNQLGLPSSSSEIPMKTINSLTSNEMMLSALKNSQHRTSPKSSCLKSESILKSYKKTFQKPYFEKVRLQRPEITRSKNLRPFAYSNSLATLQPKKICHKDFKRTRKAYLETVNSENEMSQGTDIDSVFSDWSVPQRVNEILNDKSKNDKVGYYTEEFSQVISIQSNSVIDWDQISEMIKSPTLK